MEHEKTLRLIAASLRLASAGLSIYITLRKAKEVRPNGYWKEATPDEKNKVEEELSEMVASYSAQVN